MRTAVFFAMRLFIAVAFAMLLLRPLDVAVADNEQPPAGESVPVEEGMPVDEGEVVSSENEETTVDDLAPPAYEDEPAAGEKPVGELVVEESVEESPVVEESSEEQPAVDEMDEKQLINDEVDEEQGTGEGSVDSELPVGEVTSAGDAEAEATEEPIVEDSGSEPFGEEQTTGEKNNDVEDETSSPEEEVQSLVEVVTEMADANAMLVNEAGEAIPMASEEAGVLLAENTALLQNVVLPTAASVIAQDKATSVFASSIQEVGQSFTVTSSGLLTKIEIASDSAGASTLKIYLGENPVSGSVIYTQDVTLTDTVTATGTSVSSYTYQTLALDTPLAVSAGQKYTFGLTNWKAAWNDTNLPGDYTEGNMYTDNGGFWTRYGADDLTFRVHVDDPPPAPVPPITGNRGGGGDSEVVDSNDEGGVLKAGFIRGPEDYALVPGNYVIGGIGWFTAEDGYVSFTLPAGVSPDRVKIMFWEAGQYWSLLPGAMVVDGVIQGVSMGAGTYIMVY